MIIKADGPSALHTRTHRVGEQDDPDYKARKARLSWRAGTVVRYWEPIPYTPQVEGYEGGDKCVGGDERGLDH